MKYDHVKERIGCGIPERPEQGFTLTEVLIVILILGIMATIVLPSFNMALERSRISGAADEVVTALEFAQITAMTSGGDTRVTIDADADTILIEQFRPDADLLGGETELSENDVEGGSFVTMEYPLDPGTDYLIQFRNEDRFGNVYIASAQFGAQDSVTFNNTGAPSEGGSISLISGRNHILLTIDPVSGKVTRSD